MKNLTILEASTILLFVVGVMFYIMSLVVMPDSISFDAIESMKKATAFGYAGHMTMVAAIIAATQIGKKK